MMTMALPSARIVAQDGEELFGLLRGQHGGGLVQNQDIRPAVEHLDDLHGLLLRHRHVVDLLVRVDVEAVFLTDLLDPRGGRLEVEFPLPSRPRTMFSVAVNTSTSLKC